MTSGIHCRKTGSCGQRFSPMGSLPFLFFLTLSVSIVSGSERVKRQTDLTCTDTDTLVLTTFLYGNTTCDEKVAEVDDIYNLDYRNECQRWLLTDTVPKEVSETHVFECYDFGNGTIKYRTKICCEGKPNVTDDQLICFTCNNDGVQYEPHLRYHHSQRCNHYDEIGPQLCDPGEVCAVQLEYFHNTSHAPDHYALLTKSCMAFDDCTALQNENAEFCTLHWTPRCAYCYESMYGNYQHPFPNPDSLLFHGPCTPNPCKHRGVCNETGDQPGDYECLCHEGFWGSQCQITSCSLRLCANDAKCSALYVEPYYMCRCHIQWTGYHCNETAPLCPDNWCLNGGTCYIQDGPDERCLCPDGYVGKSCEIERQERCAGDNGALRIMTSWHGSHGVARDNNDCTFWNDFAKNWISARRANCYAHLRSSFNTGVAVYKPGVHGEVALNQDAWLYSCERGRDFTWLKIQFCCGSCGSNPCQNGGWCIPNKPTDADPYGYKCRCRFNYAGDHCQTKLKACYVMGDPHYITLDGGRFDFQGRCKYQLIENVAATNLPSFRVTNKNEYRSNSRDVTYPKHAEVEVYGHIIRLAKDLKVYLDGVNITLPYEDSAGRFTITLNGLRTRLQTEDNLVVEFYRNWLITVLAPPDAAGKVDGMCGDYDSDVSNDYILPNGIQCPEDEHLRGICIGNYFQVPDSEDPSCPQPPDIPVDDTPGGIPPDPKYCGHITNPSGPFASCISALGQEFVDIFWANCIYDVRRVYSEGELARNTAKCGNLATFAEACNGEGVPPSVDWATTTDCELDCPGDLVYKADASACRPTCDRPYYDFDCLLANTENCVCPEQDQVALPDNTCIPASQCGCMEADRKLGEVWYSDACDVAYTCEQCSGGADCDTRRPVARVVETKNPFDPCEGVVCPGSNTCIVDTSSDTCYTCCKCDPKWEGPDCKVQKTYDCDTNNPCTTDNIYFYDQYNEPDRLLVHYAHPHPAKYVQCDLFGGCTEKPCAPGTVFDNYDNVCDHSTGIQPNHEGCLNKRATCTQSQIGDVWYSVDCSLQYQCVDCPGCTSPGGILMTASYPPTEDKVLRSETRGLDSGCYDPCAGVQCPGDKQCQVDSSSATCYTCPSSCQCDPKWTGPNCSTPKRYSCNVNNPCNGENINFHGSMSPAITYFAHEDPAKYIQCEITTGDCTEHDCVSGLHFDNKWNTCNWPQALASNTNGCL